jgi:large subunit ribosomal protein L4
MESISLPIYNSEGKEVETIKLDPMIFDGKVNTAVLHQVVKLYLANQRHGLAATKTRGEVSGGGRKPWKQKGTGRARVGSTRSPLWRHGGVVFGPHPRDFSYSLPKKIKIEALRSALCSKVSEKNLMVLESFKIDAPKTKFAAKVFSNLKVLPLRKKDPLGVLLLLDKIDSDLKKALNNIVFLDFNLAKDAHAYEVLAHKKIVVTKDGLVQLAKRIK